MYACVLCVCACACALFQAMSDERRGMLEEQAKQERDAIMAAQSALLAVTPFPAARGSPPGKPSTPGVIAGDTSIDMESKVQPFVTVPGVRPPTGGADVNMFIQLELEKERRLQSACPHVPSSS